MPSSQPPSHCEQAVVLRDRRQVAIGVAIAVIAEMAPFAESVAPDPQRKRSVHRSGRG